MDINQAGGNGNITLTSNIGADTSTAGVTGVTRIGNAATADLSLDGTVYTTGDATTYRGAGIGLGGASPTFTTSADAITFGTGNVTIADGTLTVNSVGGLIDFEGSILGTSDEVLVLNADAATDGASGNEKVIVAAIGSGDQIHSVNITGRDGITLQGNITTSNKSSNNVSFTGPVAINAATVAIDTNAAGNDGTVTFSSTIDSATGTSRELDIVSAGGNVTITGAIGATTALATLDINQAGGNGNITLTSNIGADASNAGVTGVTRIGNAATADLNLNGTVYTTGGATTYASAGTDLGGSSPTFTTSADTITFTGNVTLSLIHI